MSEIKVDTIVDAAGTGKPNFSNGVTINGAALSTLNLGEYNASGTEPSSPENGSIWWNTTSEKIFIYINGEWKETIIIPPTPVFYGARGLTGGGSSSNVIDYITIATTGNATDFGDLAYQRDSPSAFSDGTYALFVHGSTNGGSTGSKQIDYVTVATTGNASDFGDAVVGSRDLGAGGQSDGTTGVWGGTYSGTALDYVTIATPANAQDFGDLTEAGRQKSAVSNGTRGVWMGGNYVGYSRTKMDYITFATPSNATDFGDLTQARYGGASAHDLTRGVLAGGRNDGGSYFNTMDYITIASAGNATDFGDATQSGEHSNGGMNDLTKGAFNLSSSGSSSNVIMYITIQTTGNATDFGDRTTNNTGVAHTAGA